MVLKPPSQWPQQVVDQYEPVRILGKGGFGSVILAKKKVTENTENNEVQQQQQQLVAMKVVGSKDSSKTDHGYAHREVDILRELSHPNIMKVLDFWELPSHANCAAVMALSYAKGPTLDQLVKFGGAVSICFGRVVMAQVVDALAYCHSRAVIHRDVKPDQIVVTGAAATQEEVWTDADANAYKNNSPEDWNKLCRTWHVTLVDFGLARALSPDDLDREKVTMRAPVKATTTNATANVDSSMGSRSSSRSRRSSAGGLDRSVSRALHRTMSALGTRLYAAPEIMQGAQENEDTSSLRWDSRHSQVDITKTFGQTVANYGMLVDAFSLGNTMKYVMTGVPPNQNVYEVIRHQKSPVTRITKWMAANLCASSKSTTAAAAANGGLAPREYQYRVWKDLPDELVRLIHGTSHPAVSQRTSVRAARRYPWIDDVLQQASDNEAGNSCNVPQEVLNHNKIDFLQCALKRSSNAKTIVEPDDNKNQSTRMVASGATIHEDEGKIVAETPISTGSEEPEQTC